MSEKADQTVVSLQRPVKKSSRLSYVGITILVLAMVVFTCVFGYGYFELSKVNLSLAKAIGGLQYQVATNEQQLTSVQKALDNAQQALQQSQALSQKQEQIMSDWRTSSQGNIQKWYVAEAQYLVRFASDQLAFTQNVSMALALLRRADQVLASQNDAALMPVRKSLAADIVKLQSMPQIDTTKLYLVLSGINAELAQLPLPSSPLQPQAAEETESAQPSDAKLPLWKIGLHKTWEELRKVVIVRYNGANAMPLVMPEEKTFLYQNLHAQLESAMWATLHGNASVYQASLQQAIEWIRKYYRQDAPLTQTLLQRLQGLQNLNIQPQTINLALTLHLFDTYLLENNQAKAI